MIYLATPFTHKDSNIMNERLSLVTKVNYILIEKGITCISPVFYGCALSEKVKNRDLSWTTWERFCKDLIDKCKMMIVLNVFEWEKSTGVTEEIKYCKDNNIPVLLLSEEEIYNFDGLNLTNFINL
jgi:hypothetical protein